MFLYTSRYCLHCIQSTLPTTEGLHETHSGTSSGTDLLQLFRVNESNEVVERSGFSFKAAVPLRDALESVKFLCLALVMHRRNSLRYMTHQIGQSLVFARVFSIHTHARIRRS